MKEIIKNNYKKLLLVLAYIVVACMVYGVWFNALWNLWYVTLITIILIVGIGILIGYFYIKPDIKKNENSIEKEQ